MAMSNFSIGPEVHAAKSALSAQLLLRANPDMVSPMSTMNPVVTPSPESNVVAVGVGEKVTRGISTGIPAVKVFVRVKFAEGDIPLQHRIQTEFEGVAVDVEQIGTVRTFKAPTDPRVKIRPAAPGCSIGFVHPDADFLMAGTFGALVKRNGKFFALSNNHVLANQNRLPAGSEIVQPGLLDDNTRTNVIGRLAKFVPLAAENRVDAAIAEIDPDFVTNEILFIGPPNGTTPATVDMTVHKFGRTTSYRVGRVVSINTDVKVAYDTGELLFRQQMIIRGINFEQFSAAGDSGSLILRRSTNEATGLLFAGSATHTIANQIDDVLAALNITLA